MSVEAATDSLPQIETIGRGVERIFLNDNWSFREASRSGMPEHRILPWLDAQVPGSVFLDLHRAGVIPDPFVRFHERDVEWVDNADWEYRTTFIVNNLPTAHRYLHFWGLDTVAEIELNGVPIGSSDNMYISHRFSVDGVLKEGENTLRVLFRSALLTGNERKAAFEKYYGEQLPHNWDWWAARSFLRKAQYMYGWDWGPVLMGAGIWQNVELITVPAAEITGWKYDYGLRGLQANIQVSAEIAVFAESDYSLKLRIVGPGVDLSSVQSAPGLSGAAEVVFDQLTIPVELWQPNGLGTQPLYSVELSLLENGDSQPLASTGGKIGFRTLDLLHEPDADGKGEGFVFVVNGEKIFAKGANWIPNDSFPARSTEVDVRQRIAQARDAGFNMLRVWGGGFYESEYFYDICDEFGILVWQDFPYGCAYYPDDPVYADVARTEATAAVRRIRNHVSLALWCGNNENHTMYQGPWGGIRPKRFLGEVLYHEVLPAVVAAENPQTPYWPGSPYGGDDYNSADYGDCHNWDVWHGRGDWIHYSSNTSRFCSEFGFAASCGNAAWDTVLADQDRSPYSPVVRWHDKTRKGYDIYLGLAAIHFPVPETIDDLVYYTQLNQAEALKYGVEHYRRIKGRCWGTLYWQLNDCWPVQSWAVIDSLGEQKAAYYATKKFYAPVLVSLVRTDEAIEVHLVNDHLRQVSGNISLNVTSFAGESWFTHNVAAEVGPNASTLISSFPIDGLATLSGGYAYCEFTDADSGDVVDNLLFLLEPKDFVLDKPTISVEKQVFNDGSLKLLITADSFAPYVRIAADDHTPLSCSDNFFHLLPGRTKSVTVRSGLLGEHSIHDLSITVSAFEAPAK